jgi:cellulose synthase/poly-beta-1,6-N-acetylglucosamine synthase-like glycosyltransferase
MIISGVILIFLYVILLIWVAIGFIKLPGFSSEKTIPQSSFSIVIPFRNEAENLSSLIESLKQIDYPNSLFEIILIDDDSEDDSIEIINNEISRIARNDIQIRIIKNHRISASPKKDAITEAIQIAKKEWILTTDADCQVPSTWLKTLDAFIQQHSFDFIAAPVSLKTGNGLLQNFQLFDHCSLQSLTMGTFGMGNPLLCNGANVCYKKSLFITLNGFKGNDHIASGDDIFMLEKALQKNPSIVGFLKSKNAIVSTRAQHSWSTLLHQRVRWASKTSYQKSSASKGIGILVFVTNLWFVVGCIALCFQKEIWVPLLLLFLIKMIVDGLIIYLSAHFFRSKKNIYYYLMSSLVYPFFTVVIVVKSLTSNYNWKGRNYRSAS